MAMYAKRGIPSVALASLVLLASAPAASAAEAPAEPQLPSPTCAEGPERAGDVIVGTPCSDTIHVPATVQLVKAGAGNDTIIAGPITAATTPTECPLPGCHLELGSTVFEGGPGNDVVWGDRGNDILRGNGGDDWLWGGIGDDVLEGGPGNDKLSGGFGADRIDGGEGSDLVRGDATQDKIEDSGTTGIDTLSFATGVTPGFGNGPAFPGNPAYPEFSVEHAGFPAGGQERGVYLTLTAKTEESGNNGGAPNGGGVDEIDGPDFERIIGSPFSDYIVGGSSTQQIYGGGGADVLIAKAGAGTALDGGADGDDCVNGATHVSCESTAAQGAVTLRDKSKVSVGEMVPGGEYAELYLIGSEGDDDLTVTSNGPLLGEPGGAVTFELGAGSSFDEAASAQSGCEVETSQKAVCELTAPLDSVLLAGLEGDDRLEAPALPSTVSLILLGGNKADNLTAGAFSDDTLVDGPGNDVLRGLAGDDGFVNNEGKDEIFGEEGNDLILSTVVCEGDTINGGPGRDNASWAKFKEEEEGAGHGVEARLDLGEAGRPGSGGEAECSGPGEALGSLEQIEDLEGSIYADVLIGDAGENQILGHQGADVFSSEAGNDVILANNGDDDASIDCGEGIDTALIDVHPKYDDPVPVECETVRESEPNQYRVPETPLKPEEPPPPPPPDVKPPQTRIAHHPPRLLLSARRHRRVSFRFTSNEAGSTFFCKLDSGPYRRCRSPRVFGVGLGAHVVRIYAVDAAGNRDRTPSVFRFQLRLKPPIPRGAR
ncbi:MAG TPA: calcium-binding protein [Solirubrobacterales bacterium]|nr:calcium-binding protein [Solirubrobacterales bacterium]